MDSLGAGKYLADDALDLSLIGYERAIYRFCRDLPVIVTCKREGSINRFGLRVLRYLDAIDGRVALFCELRFLLCPGVVCHCRHRPSPLLGRVPILRRTFAVCNKS